MKSHSMECRNECGSEIYFDDEVKSSSGKSIPLDVDTDEPHDCPNSDWHRAGKSISPTKTLAQRLSELEARVAILESMK